MRADGGDAKVPRKLGISRRIRGDGGDSDRGKLNAAGVLREGGKVARAEGAAEQKVAAMQHQHANRGCHGGAVSGNGFSTDGCNAVTASW